MEVQEIHFSGKVLSAFRASRGALEMVHGDVVTLTVDVSHQTLAPVRCQDHHQGHRSRRWHRLDAFLTVAAVASVLQD